MKTILANTIFYGLCPICIALVLAALGVIGYGLYVCRDTRQFLICLGIGASAVLVGYVFAWSDKHRT